MNLSTVLLEIPMGLSMLVIVSCALITLSFIGRSYYISHRDRRKIAQLKDELALLQVGKRTPLSYKILTVMHRSYSTGKSQDLVDEFSRLATIRVVEEVQSIRSYEKLRQYMQGYETLVSPMLLSVHQAVITSCGTHVGELFTAEFETIAKMTGGYQDQIRSLNVFIAELSSPCFEHFYYQKGNKKQAEKMRNELQARIDGREEAVVRSIGDTQSSSQEKTAN